MATEWGQGLVGSWNTAGWFDKPLTVGDRLAPLIGAGNGQVVVGDSTSINLYKAVGAALGMRPDRAVVLSEAGSFPTDLYMLQGMTAWTGRHRLELMDADRGNLQQMLTPDVAVVVLSHVDYRTGELLDMQAITEQIHAAGALVVWDLCHSIGVVQMDLAGCDADFAIGCTYKYVNAGPAVRRSSTSHRGCKRRRSNLYRAGTGTRRRSPSSPITSQEKGSRVSASALRRSSPTRRSRSVSTCSPSSTSHRCGARARR